MSLLEVKLAQFCAADHSNGDSFAGEIITPVAHEEVDSTSIDNNVHDAIYLNLENFSLNYTSSFLNADQPLSNLNINYPGVKGEMEKYMKTRPESQKTLTDHLHSRDNHSYSVSLQTLTLDNRTKTDGQAIACAVCSYEFHDPNEMTKHMKTHDNPTWGENSTGPSANAGNVFIYQVQPSEKRLRLQTDVVPSFTCEMCGYRTNTKPELKKHVLVHTDRNHTIEHIQEKPYECKICNFSCLNMRELCQHKRGHKRPFVCPICQFAYSRKSDLTRHIRTNLCRKQNETSAIHEFTCDTCNYKTETMSKLKNHLLTHWTEKPFACDICNKKFKTESYLKQHKLIHVEVKPFSCETCQLSFSKSVAYKWHRMSAHSGERPFKCDKCPASFVRRDSYKNHMEITHSTDRPFACSKCSYTSKTSLCLQKHQVTHTEERNFVCSMCPCAYKQSRDLKNHILKIHEGFKPHTCPEEGCDYRTANLMHLRTHALTHSDLKLFHCDKCDFKTTRLTGLYQHKIIHTDRKPHKCPLCKLSCRAPRYLKQHIRTHLNNRSQCPLCEFTSESESSLVEHVVEHTPEMPYHCKFCSFSCLKIRELWEHRRVHKRPFVCGICHSTFVRKNDLTKHTKSNCKERSKTYCVEEFTCDICNFKTKTISRLKNHMFRHRTEKPFTCDICDRKFKSERHLKMHKLTHLEVKPFSCETCQLSFCKSEAYKSHRMAAHTGERPFKCNKCPASFVRRTGYKNHMEITHSTDRPFACSKCSYTSKTLKCLQIHQVTHTEERGFVCSMCPCAYKRSRDLKNHILKIHEGFKPHTCPEKDCDYRTANLIHLRTHALTHSDLKVFHCNKCDFKTTRLTGLYQHKIIHTDRKPHKCPLCKLSCRAPRYLKQHIRTHLNNRSQCPLCEFTSESESSLVEHVVEHTPEMPYHCKFCSFSCLKIRELWEHRRVHKRPFVCGICHSTFVGKNDLTRHMKTNCKERSKTYSAEEFICDICNFRTKTISRLKNHMVTHCTEKPFTCDICDRKFKSEHHLNRHKLIHVKVKSFSCESCQLSFSTSQSYKWHRMQVHTGERLFKCDKCPASFVRRDGYKKHMQITHSTDRPFACSKCSYTSKTLKCLQIHQVTHTEERGFVCSMCPCAYKRSRDLKNHILKIHEGFKPHTCPEEGCDYRTANLIHLRTHALTHSDLKLFHCNKCDFKTPRLTGLNQHKLIHTDRKPHKCPLCKFSCRTPRDLRRHIHTHLSNRSQCPLCEFTSESESSLVEHVVEHAPEMPYHCKFCSFSCLKIRELWEHRQVHKRPFFCPMCHLTFVRKNDLTQHMKSNCKERFKHIQSHLRNKTQDEKPYRCDLCGQGFMMKTTIKRHCLVHLEEKFYECSICGHRCNNASDLKNHKRWHRRHRPVQSYSKSGRRGRQAQNGPRRVRDLPHHKYKHTNSKLYECELCTFRSNHELELDQHMQQQHAEMLFTCVKCPYKTHNLNRLWTHTKEKHGSRKSNMIVTDRDDLHDFSQVSHPLSESDGSDNDNSQPEEDFEIVIEKDGCVEDTPTLQGIIVSNSGNPLSGNDNSDRDSHQNEDLKLLENSACPNMHTKETGSCIVNKSVMDIRDHEESYSSSPGCQPQIENCSSAETFHSEDCKIIIKKEMYSEDAFDSQKITNQSFHHTGAENQNCGLHPQVEKQHFNYLPGAENQNSDTYSWAEKQNSDHYHSRAKNQNHDPFPWTENQNSDEHPQPGIYDSEEQSQANDCGEIIIMKSSQFAENTFDCQEKIDLNFHNPVMEIHKSVMRSTDHEEPHDSLHLCGEDHNSTANAQLNEDHNNIIVKEEADKDVHDRQEIVTNG